MLKLQFLCLRVPVAQWIERQLAELKVAGSNPARHAMFYKRFGQLFIKVTYES